MNSNTILNAVELGKRMKHVFVATADSRGLPHLAAAGTISAVSESHIAIEAWFCPGTVQNILCNSLISVVAWDPATDIGHQILGEIEKIEETAMTDGFSPDIETKAQFPQTERKLIIRVDKVLAFSHAPHSDVVE
ncbi:MAG: pyridoxamine 5'-phosphate oxidase family protein [Desulfuromonadales bacterium]|nr:pyridoxamine 5'-phosphate oxidase family protein [Desulfuromonadales bacterium]